MISLIENMPKLFDIDQMLGYAIEAGMESEVVLAFGDYREQGFTVAEAVAKVLVDFDL